MLDQIVLWERDAFLWLNSLHSPFWDSFMYIISARWSWAAVVVAMLVWICWKRPPRESLLFLLFVILMMLCTDQFSSGFAKPFFARPRPGFHPYTADLVKNLFFDKGGGFGFFSGHATNFFALATFTSLVFRRKSYTFIVYLLAFVVAYSRICLGKHFISDVLVGIVVGFLAGWLFFKLYRLARRRLFFYLDRREKKGDESYTYATYSLKEPCEVYASNLDTLILILCCFLFFLVFFSLDVVRILHNIGYY